MITPLDAGVTTAMVADDEVYNSDPDLRTGLEKRCAGYVLAAASANVVTTE